MYKKKSMTAIVATSILIVVTVIAVVAFQSWWGTYSSSILNRVEISSENDLGTNGVEGIIGSTLYFKNGEDFNVSITSIRIDGNDCNVSQSISSGIKEITLNNNCTQNLSTINPEIIVITSQGVYSEYYSVSEDSVSIQNTPTPNLLFSVNSSIIPFNTSINLSWTGTNLDNCSATGNWTGIKNISGSEIISNLISNSTFSLFCDGSYGNVTQQLNVTVTPLPIITFNVSSSALAFNSSATLTWNVVNADSCSASGNWSTPINVSGNFSTGNLLNESYTYNITCVGSGGTSSSSLGVYVYPQCIASSQSFTVVGSSSLDIPLGCFNIMVKAWGAGGVGGAYYCGTCGGRGGQGGGGGFMQSNFSLNSGETLNITVGQGGTAGQGGGFSSVKLNSSILLVAGGGGRGGYCQHNYYGGDGGGGGGFIGGDGTAATYSSLPPGLGANQTSSGQNWDGSYSGSMMSSNGYFPGGSGQVYVGGAIGRCDAGFGGGSGFINETGIGNISISASGRTAANTGDSDYIGSKGLGGNYGYGGTWDSGQDGLVVIYWS